MATNTGLKRTLSSCNEKAAEDIHKFIKQQQDELKDAIPILNRDVTKSSMILPEQYSTDTLRLCVDVRTLNELEEDKSLNWCIGCRHLLPLDVLNDGNSLLHSLSVYMFGVQDRRNVLRQLLYQRLFMEMDKDAPIRSRWSFARNMKSASTWNKIIEMASEKKIPGHDRFTDLSSIHVFTMSNILARPIIVCGNSHRQLDESASGIYLPLLRRPQDCEKSPIILGCKDNHFVPLISSENLKIPLSKTMVSEDAHHCIPLINYDLSPLKSHFLLPREDVGSHLQQQRNTYLDVINIPYTVRKPEKMIDAAMLKFKTPPAFSIELMWSLDQFASSIEQQYLVPVSTPHQQQHLSGNTPQQQQQHVSGNTPQQQQHVPSQLEHTNDNHYESMQKFNVDDNLYEALLVCATEGCTNNESSCNDQKLCGECYKKSLATKPGLCSSHFCSNNRANNSQGMCNPCYNGYISTKNTPSKELTNPVKNYDVSKFTGQHGVDVPKIVASPKAALICVTPSCKFAGLKPLNGYCQACYMANEEKMEVDDVGEDNFDVTVARQNYERREENNYNVHNDNTYDRLSGGRGDVNKNMLAGYADGYDRLPKGAIDSRQAADQRPIANLEGKHQQAIGHQKEMHQQAIGHEQGMHQQSMVNQQEMHRRAMDHQQRIHQETMVAQQGANASRLQDVPQLPVAGGGGAGGGAWGASAGGGACGGGAGDGAWGGGAGGSVGAADYPPAIRHGDSIRSKVLCKVAGCTRCIGGDGEHCNEHNPKAQHRKQPITCFMPGCSNTSEYNDKGLCMVCYQSQRHVVREHELLDNKRNLQSIAPGLPPLPTPSQNNPTSHSMPNYPTFENMPQIPNLPNIPIMPPNLQGQRHDGPKFTPPKTYGGFEGYSGKDYQPRNATLNWQRGGFESATGHFPAAEAAAPTAAAATAGGGEKCIHCDNHANPAKAGLCNECHRQREDATHQVVPDDPPAEATKCINDGCRGAGHERFSFLCEKCYQKQLGAIKDEAGLAQPMPPQEPNQDNFMGVGAGNQDNFMGGGAGNQENFMGGGAGNQDNFMGGGAGNQDNFMFGGAGVATVHNPGGNTPYDFRGDPAQTHMNQRFIPPRPMEVQQGQFSTNGMQTVNRRPIDQGGMGGGQGNYYNMVRPAVSNPIATDAAPIVSIAGGTGTAYSPPPPQIAVKQVCKGLSCQFYGSDEYGGYCSGCFLEISKKEAVKLDGIRTYAPPTLEAAPPQQQPPPQTEATRCRSTDCENYGSQERNGFCSICHRMAGRGN